MRGKIFDLFAGRQAHVAGELVVLDVQDQARSREVRGALEQLDSRR